MNQKGMQEELIIGPIYFTSISLHPPGITEEVHKIILG
jgi:hypothetical protein